MLTEGIFDMRTPQPEWLWDKAGLIIRAGAALTSGLGWVIRSQRGLQQPGAAKRFLRRDPDQCRDHY
jgi:hypothetical protein